MKEIKEILNNERGVVMVISLMILTLLVGAGVGAIVSTQTDLKTSGNIKTATQAFYIAAAGIEHAHQELADGTNDFNSVFGAVNGTLIVSNNNLNGGSYTVTKQDSQSNPSRIKLRSVGTAPNNAKTVIEAQFKGGGSPFDSGAFGKVSLTIGSGGGTDSYNSANASSCPPNSNAGFCAAIKGANGDVGSNGDVSLASGVTVDGDATANGTVTLDSGASVTGSTTNGATERVLEAVDATFRTPNDNGTITDFSIYNSTTHNLGLDSNELTLSTGTYYFNNLILDGNAKLIITGDVTIYLTGVFTTSSGSKANVDNSPQSKFNVPSRMVIYSSCTNTTPFCVDVASSSGFSGAMYVPDGSIRINTGGDVYGSLIGGSIDLASGSDFHYDEALANLATPFGGKVEMFAWTEKF